MTLDKQCTLESLLQQHEAVDSVGLGGGGGGEGGAYLNVCFYL